MMFRFLAPAIFMMVSACSTMAPPVGRAPSREARYQECLASEAQKAQVAGQIAPIYGVKVSEVASPQVNRCEAILGGGGNVSGQPGFNTTPSISSSCDQGQFLTRGGYQACQRNESRRLWQIKGRVSDEVRRIGLNANCAAYGGAGSELWQTCESERQRMADRVDSYQNRRWGW